LADNSCFLVGYRSHRIFVAKSPSRSHTE
jgi:hypothetical protein